MGHDSAQVVYARRVSTQLDTAHLVSAEINGRLRRDAVQRAGSTVTSRPARSQFETYAMRV